MPELQYWELNDYFRNKVILDTPNENQQGSPFIKLNHSEWLKNEIYSGEMINSKIVWTVQVFKKQKSVVIFDTPKPYVQTMIKESGSFYLKEHATNASNKVKFTTSLENLCKFEEDTKLPSDISNVIKFQCQMAQSSFLNNLTDSIGEAKNFIKNLESFFDYEFDFDQMNELLNLSRKLILEKIDYKEYIIKYISKHPKLFFNNKRILQNYELILKKIDFLNLNLKTISFNEDIWVLTEELVKLNLKSKWKGPILKLLKVGKKITKTVAKSIAAVETGGASIAMNRALKFSKRTIKISLKTYQISKLANSIYQIKKAPSELEERIEEKIKELGIDNKIWKFLF